MDHPSKILRAERRKIMRIITSKRSDWVLKITLKIGFLVLLLPTNIHAEEPAVASGSPEYNYCKWLKQKIREYIAIPDLQRAKAYRQFYKANCGFPPSQLSTQSPCSFTCNGIPGRIQEPNTIIGGNYCHFLCQTRCAARGTTCKSYQIRPSLAGITLPPDVTYTGDFPTSDDFFEELGEVYIENDMNDMPEDTTDSD